MPGAAAKTYRAFISYNRSDAATAAALAAGLTRFARPWYRTRAMRVFLDRNSLSTDPTLSGAIERALAASEWLILLASPNSAAAPWVRHEVEWWLAHRDISKLIVAQTGGVIAWQGVDGADFDWDLTTALPPVLRGRFARQPLWADLRAAAATPHRSLRDPVFRDGFLLVAAQVHGVSKDALWNAETGEQRKRIVFAAVALTGVVAFAWGGYNQYSVSMDRKENLASIQLGAKAFMVLPNDPQLAAQIALVGVALRPSGVAASALRTAVARLAGEVAPQVEVTVPGAVDIAFSAHATQLAVLTRNGRVRLLDVASGRVLGEAVTADRAWVVAWSADGTLAIGGETGLHLLTFGGSHGTTALARMVPLPDIRALAFSADGKRVATAHADGAVRILAVAASVVERTFVAHPGGVRAVAFANDGKRLATGGDHGDAALWEIATGLPVFRFRLDRPVVTVDFNRQRSGTRVEHTLAVADAGGGVRLVDAGADEARARLRAIDLPPRRGAGAGARFVESGRCLARANRAGSIELDASSGFQTLLELGRPHPDPDPDLVRAPTIAMAVAATSHFAQLDAAGRVTLHAQPLCGDAEAVCAFAQSRLTAPLTVGNRARWIPPGVDLDATVQQPPGPACRRLIDAVVRPPPANADR